MRPSLVWGKMRNKAVFGTGSRGSIYFAAIYSQQRNYCMDKARLAKLERRSVAHIRGLVSAARDSHHAMIRELRRAIGG